MICLFSSIKEILPDSREYPFKGGGLESKKISDYSPLHMFTGQQ